VIETSRIPMTAVAAQRGSRPRPTIFARTYIDAGFSRLVHQERRPTMSEVQHWHQLFEKIIGSWVSRAIYATEELRLANHLAAGLHVMRAIPPHTPLALRTPPRRTAPRPHPPRRTGRHHSTYGWCATRIDILTHHFLKMLRGSCRVSTGGGEFPAEGWRSRHVAGPPERTVASGPIPDRPRPIAPG
jgi:hypothetical protein